MLPLLHSTSFRSHSISLGLLTQATVSKQALAKRFVRAVNFVQLALHYLCQRHFCFACCLKRGKFSLFNRILIQDSTTLNVPSKLAQFFPGTGQKKAKKPDALVKIQTIYELFSDRFLRFELTAYRLNDQSATDCFESLLKKGDLLIRDLGYFSTAFILKMTQNSIWFISRWLFGTQLFDFDTQQPLAISELLRNQTAVDTRVLLGSKQKVPVRLVAQKVPPLVRAQRRRKANSCRRFHYSKLYMSLLDWDIYITNIPSEMLLLNWVIKAYRLRWRIEILFKSWKSHFHMESLEVGSKQQLEVLIYSKLMFITVFQSSCMEMIFCEKMHAQTEALSVLKTASFIRQYLIVLLIGQHNGDKKNDLFKKQILYHCRYEKRHRTAFTDLLMEFLS